MSLDPEIERVVRGLSEAPMPELSDEGRRRLAAARVEGARLDRFLGVAAPEDRPVRTYRTGPPDHWLERLEALAGSLVLGERVIAISPGHESAMRFLARVRASALFRVLPPVEAILPGHCWYELRFQNGATLRFDWSKGLNHLRGFEGRVVLDEMACQDSNGMA